MTTRREEPRYDIQNSVQVYVGDTKFFVFLEAEVVVQEVTSRCGRTFYRRVTSKFIETTAILRASDKVNA